MMMMMMTTTTMMMMMMMMMMIMVIDDDNNPFGQLGLWAPPLRVRDVFTQYRQDRGGEDRLKNRGHGQDRLKNKGGKDKVGYK